MYASEPKAHVESWVPDMAIGCNICVSKKFGIKISNCEYLRIVEFYGKTKS